MEETQLGAWLSRVVEVVSVTMVLVVVEVVVGPVEVVPSVVVTPRGNSATVGPSFRVCPLASIANRQTARMVMARSMQTPQSRCHPRQQPGTRK